MPYRPPLVAREFFVADPPELPQRAPGEQGLSAVKSAEVVETGPSSVLLKAVTSAEEELYVRLTAVAEGVIRARLSADPDVRPDSAKVIEMLNVGEYEGARIAVDGASVTVDAGSVKAVVTLDEWTLLYTDAAGKTLVAQNPGEVDISGRLRTLPFGRSLVDGEPVAYHESFTCAPDEAFAGFGERFAPLNARGQRPLMWNFDAFGSESIRAYKNVPIYVSSRGYGIVVNSGAPVEFDVAQQTHAAVEILVPDSVMEYFVLAGTPVEVLDRFDGISSRPVLPPKWAFGTWISSGFFEDSRGQVMERAKKIRERGIPCDVLHLDTFWQTDGRWSDMQWDPENFPEPDSMLADLAEQGFKVCLWMNSYISYKSPLFKVADEKGYFLKNAKGETYVADTWHGTFPACGIVDFTNPEATAWWQDLLRPPLQAGAALYKTDFAEGVPADAVAFNGMSGTELHNVYTLLFNDAVCEVTREIHGYDFVWARSSFLGGQRHPAQWSGDVQTTWAGLGGTIRGGASHGLSGMPFWSHDTGGFNGTPTDDLYIRWAQFGALSPLLRYHGTTTRELWEFSEEAERLAIESLKLRYSLAPYIYSAAVKSSRTGEPVLRALSVDNPGDPVAWNADQEYRFGTDLLVAPVNDPSGERKVYLPEGRWIDFWTKEVIEGGRYIDTKHELETFPVFVRYGAILPRVEPGATFGDEPFEAITLQVWGTPDRDLVISDVNGDTKVSVTVSETYVTLVSQGPADISKVEVVDVDGKPEKVGLER
ncbi:TIM-barrel domain-containing protein [Glycomyces buryatensis]|uniref:Alpha-xylosidase n=1 Tax=Glycomyces buryatensis TaxID=2570927 RepID=A0A4S8Q3K0_9ACTN|nr:TIM-barrel domain-containing protein [Glycomyces buryatensis]THV38590.1 alpha-xylosidase [Glycomyces buryatensis]